MQLPCLAETGLLQQPHAELLHLLQLYGTSRAVYEHCSRVACSQRNGCREGGSPDGERGAAYMQVLITTHSIAVSRVPRLTVKSVREFVG